MSKLELIALEVVEPTQLVEVRLHDPSVDRVYLTLAESEALIKDLSVANAKLRGLIARDGDISGRAA